jgi:protocatechuate 3,4-dioxygenase beta subunit
MAASKKLSTRVSRREVLRLMAGAGAGAVAATTCGDDGKTALTPAATGTPAAAGATATTQVSDVPTESTVSCVVSPEMTEGPYFVDEMFNRSDIRSDPDTGAVRQGVPLELVIGVQQVNGSSCTPLAGALVDVWHCDAEGLYSDVEQNGTVGEKFLRGYQLTDEDGQARFTTIYPGWYTGRAVHIHIKVRTDPDAQQGYEFTSQLFFDEAVTEQVYEQPPYDERGPADTSNAADMIYGGGGAEMLLALAPQGEGYLGTITIGTRVS